jgi:uncharacterized MAPEG superfamily protein
MTIGFWCVLVAGLLPMLAGFIAKGAKPGYDNNNPRQFLAALDGVGARANAAMQNGFEGFPLFAAAVIIAHYLQADQSSIDQLALGYIAARVVYTLVYAKGWGTVRSLVWGVGLACIIGLFVVSS